MRAATRLCPIPVRASETTSCVDREIATTTLRKIFVLLVGVGVVMIMCAYVRLFLVLFLYFPSCVRVSVV
jgi:hypothetical protein